MHDLERNMKDGSVTLNGYYPGVIGEIVKLHGSYYHEHWDFDITFEVEVAMELAEFMHRFDDGRDGFWAATSDGRFLGSLSLDGSTAQDEGARLRWFIVDPGAQGLGVGTQLMETALSFARAKKYEQIYLWTFEGLTSARKIYDRFGFEVIHQEWMVEWGRELLQQKLMLAK